MLSPIPVLNYTVFVNTKIFVMDREPAFVDCILSAKVVYIDTYFSVHNLLARADSSWKKRTK